MGKQNLSNGPLLLRLLWVFPFEGEFGCFCASELIAKSPGRKKKGVLSAVNVLIFVNLRLVSYIYRRSQVAT